MERDFLGMGEKNRCYSDSAFATSSMVQRQFPNNMTNLQQQIMTFKTVANDGRYKKNDYDQYFSRSSSSVLYPQKNLSMDGQGAHLFPMPMYPPYSSMASNSYGHAIVQHQSSLSASPDTRMFPMVSNHTMPMMQGNIFKGHGSRPGTTSGLSLMQYQQPSFAERSQMNSPLYNGVALGAKSPTVSVPATAQMTIFYGGVVHVYDNVSVDKARAIMSMASCDSYMSSKSKDQSNQAPQPLVSKEPLEMESISINRIQHHAGTASPSSVFSSPISVAHSGSCSSSHGNKKQQRNHMPSITKQEHEPLKTTVPAVVVVPPLDTTRPTTRAVPMARKESLARFLQKRKERALNSSPYSIQKTTESDSKNNNVNSFPQKNSSAPEKSTSPRGRRECWPVGSSPNYSTNGHQSPPKAKLEI